VEPELASKGNDKIFLWMDISSNLDSPKLREILVEKKISTYNQKVNTMISNDDLKLKITNLFSKLNPKNREGFLQKMAEYDLYKKLEMSEDSFTQEPVTKKKVGGANWYDFMSDDYAPRNEGNSHYTPRSSNNYIPRSPTNQEAVVNSPERAATREAVDEDDELAMLMGLSEVNQEFLERQLDLEEKEFVETFAISESQTIYRRDEIVSELFDTFREEGTGVIFSNDDKLKLWIDGMLKLVDDVSNKDSEGNITSVKNIDSRHKPVVENFTSGEGTGVSWLVPISKEKKKVYDAGSDGDHYFTADRVEETRIEDRVVAADPKNTDSATKYRGYDIQQRTLYELGKPNRVDDSGETPSDGTHLLDKEVYYVHDVQETGEMSLGKRVLDKGLQRIQNIYENIGKKEAKKGAKTEAKKLYETLGRKRLVGVEEVDIVEPEKLVTEGFVLTKPGGKKLKPNVSGFYQGKIEEGKSYDVENLIPFRTTGESYVLFKQKPCLSDCYSLGKTINPSMIDDKSLPLSGLYPGDKIVLRFTLPFVDFNEALIKSPTGKVSDIPITIDILVRYDSHRSAVLGENNMYTIQNYQTDLIETSSEPFTLTLVTPIYTRSSLVTGVWKNSKITVRNARVVNIFKNTSRVKEGDEVFILFTESMEDTIIKGNKRSSDEKINPFHSSAKKNISFRTATAIVLQRGGGNIEIQITGGDLTSGKKITMGLNDFDLVFVTKDIERGQKMVTDLFESSENYGKYAAAKPTIDIKPSSDDSKTAVWGKVISKDTNYTLVQLLQSTDSAKFGDYMLLENSKIDYTLPKYVYESSDIGGFADWTRGIFMNTEVSVLVPTLQEFLNKLSRKLRNKESIHYSFFEDISKLALDFEKYEITATTKNRIDMWIQYNLVKHLEDMMNNNYRIHANYSRLLKLFEDTDEINPEKFRLNRGITIPDYSEWTVETTKHTYTSVPNTELVSEITNAFNNNTALWGKLDIKRLTRKQAMRLMEKKVPFEKKWNQFIHFKAQPKAKELVLIEAIHAIKDPIVRSRILSEFIEKDCYLGEDSATGTNWYYSKLDITRTKLVCPHVYLEIMGQQLTDYASEPLKDGSVVCKNCGQILNSIVFSYFEGYDEEDRMRGRVQIVNGREVVGTMADTELLVEQKHVFSETDNPEEYALELIFDNYASALLPKVQTAISAEREAKLEAINDCQFYMLQYNIGDYSAWYSKNKDVLLGAISKLTKVQSKIDELVRSKFNQYLASRKNSIVLARLAIMAEKEVSDMPREETIDTALKVTEARRIEKGEKPANLENIRKEVLKDYTNFTSSPIFPNIADLYKRDESEYEREEEKTLYEEKFADYTSSNIDESLSLFDAVRWLKYYIRTTHKDQRIKGEVSEQECVPGVQEFHSYGTNSERAETIEQLEKFVSSKMPNPQDRTGVKTRKQFYSDIVVEEPTLPEKESELLEAKLIIKNLYGIPNSKTELKAYIDAVTGDIVKYRMVDYLVAYKKDPISGQVVTRMYENGVETELDITREQLIAKYLAMSPSDLSGEFLTLKHSEIELEKYEVSVEVHDCVQPPKPESMVSTTIDKIQEKLLATLGDSKSGEINRAMKMLREMEKEYVDGVYTVNKLCDKKSRKVALYKEYERLSKMLTYLKRDYNYLANGVNLRERKAKLATQLDIKFKEGETLEGFQTEYDYLFKYMDWEGYKGLRSAITALSASDVVLEELTDCDVNDEVEVLVMRNTRNKYRFCANLLRIILQMMYVWEEMKFNKYNTPDKISRIDIEIDYQLEDGDVMDSKLCEFVLDFINGVNKLLRREEETFKGIEDYKERNFELVKQMERVKRMKFVDDIGSDLIREFSKVMKGKQTLKVGVRELGSDSPLETAKVVDQGHYEVNPNGEGNYGAVFTNDLEGDGDDYNEEEAMDMLE
jgi:hypothetical protein